MTRRPPLSSVLPTATVPPVSPSLAVPVPAPEPLSGVPPALAASFRQARDWLAAQAPGAALRCDSRRVIAGDVFLAFAAAPQFGIATDGRAFIADALARGAAAVLFDDQDYTWDAEATVPHLACPQLRRLAGPLARTHYGCADRAMFAVAVTGTNGKTSCTQWLGAALSRSGAPTVVVGTFGAGMFEAGSSRGFDSTGYTTPDAVQLHAALARARADGATALAIEASSIGLQQQRLAGLHLDVALFTNLSRDHLDYHGAMAAYEAAKTMLFDWPGLRHAVINLDDPMGLRLLAHLRRSRPSLHLTGYTLVAATATAQLAALGPHGLCLHASELRGSHTGTQFQLALTTASATGGAPVPSQSVPSPSVPSQLVRSQLVGDFNVSNLLGVFGVLLARGLAPADALAALETLQPVPGRMQQLGAADQPLVVIDYAHTPDALEKTLASLRRLAQARDGALWCVFGCGGDRDPGKRAQMGAAAQAADHVIVTSDNPRSEQPAAIIADIVAGFAAATPPQVIEDRATAILWSLRHAARADVILLAGKGHESTQEINGRKLPFRDADHAALALAARATMKGPA